MKEKILAAIKAKFPTAKLSAKRLDALSATIEAKAGTDETLIDPALDALNEIYPLTEIAKDDHIRSTLEGKLKATQQNQKKEGDEPLPPTDIPDDTPAWAKALIEQNKTFAQQMAAIQGKETANTIRGKATELLKEVPESYWGKRAIPDKVEDIEAFVTEVTADYTAFTKELTDKGLATIPIPGGGSPTAGKEKIDPELKAFVESQKATSAATPAPTNNMIIKSK